MLRAVRLAALRDSPEAFTTTLEAARASTEQQWRDVTGRRALAFADGTAVGMVGWAESRSHWELISLWVAPSVRGRGAANRLVEFVVERAAGAPVELEVRRTNDRARRFYERAGFRAVDVAASEPANLRMRYEPATVPR